MSAQRAPPWLQRVLPEAGIRFDQDAASITRLGGGVSSDVFLVEAGDGGPRVVLKRPLERFRVADPWVVPSNRAYVEAEAARLFTNGLPAGSVAALVGLYEDQGAPVLVFQAAPSGWRPWKQALLQHCAQTAPAHAAGHLLARLHAIGASLEDSVCSNDALFHAQRIEPYLRTSARRVPAARVHLDRLEDSFFARRDLVHGDFSPKNMLVAPQGGDLMLVDHEVVTRGDAAFDLAFLWTHLALKSVHHPVSADGFFACAEAACSAYRQADVGARPDPHAVVTRALYWVPALLLARVVGKSPVEYLRLPLRARLVASALALLEDPPGDLRGLWGHCREKPSS